MQKNYDSRCGQSVFKSRTGRTKLGGNSAFMAPPVGLYEHKFKQGATHTTKCSSKDPANRKSPDFKPEKIGREAPINMRLISKPHTKDPNTQAFSCLAETREVDFGLS